MRGGWKSAVVGNVINCESGAIEEGGIPIEVKPAWKFVLQDLIG
ncbi:hypothetical protein [Adlercreutzia sp. ZJ473]|nr:hypothetical protein [Adlercreutzia sp. ZJ473]